MSDGLRLVSAILENGSSVSFRLLEPDYFVGQAEQDAYNYSRTHYRRYSELPTLETVERETGNALPDAPENVDYYLSKVMDRRLYNSVRQPFADLRTSLSDHDMEGARGHIDNLKAQTRILRPQQDVQTIREVGDDVLTHYDSMHLSMGLTGIPTGWTTTDEETGGYQNGDLITIVARPGIGKTFILIHKAKAAFLAGYSVLFVSMEMTLTQIGSRFHSIHAGINPKYVRKGMLSTMMYRKLRESILTLDNCNRFHLYAGNMQKKVDDLDLLVQELNPDIIYIDGMYLMKSSSNGYKTSRWDNVAAVVDDLKKMTIARDRPIVTTTQFGRDAGSGGKQGSLENIGYSDTIGTHSSLVYGLRPGPTLGTDENPKKHLDIEFLKGREGEQGGMTIKYSFAPVCFDQAYLDLDNTGGGGDAVEQSPGMDWDGQ